MSTIINATTTNGVVIQPDNSGSLQLQTNNGTTALTIDTSQRVGIGTTSPTTLLSFPATEGTAGDANRISLYTNGANIYGFGISSGQLNIRAGDSGNIVFFTSAAGTATERMRINSSGNLQFNSGYGSVATAYGCRAWVNFNGTSTVAIRASGNVTSITDNGVGNYTINFTTSMPDANYSVGHAVKYQAGTTLNNTQFQFINSSGNVQVFTSDNAGNLTDFAFVCVQVFR